MNNKATVFLFANSATAYGVLRSIAPYRLRTALEETGRFRVIVIDFLSDLIDSGQIYSVLDKYELNEKCICGLSSTFFVSKNSLRGWAHADHPSQSEESFIHFLKYLKSKKAKVVMGGPKAQQFSGDKYAAYIDHYVLGLADEAIIDLFDKLKQHDHDSEKFFRKNSFDIDKINTVFKKTDFIIEGEALPIEISRGCRYRCAFCSYTLNGRKINNYLRSVEDLEDEFKRNYDLFKTTHYRFLDDTFNESGDKLNHVFEAIKRLPFNIHIEAYIRHDLLDLEQLQLLKMMGLKSAVLGIETLNEENAKWIGKGLDPEQTLFKVKQLKKIIPDCYVSSGFIIGLPEDKADKFDWAFDIAKRKELFDFILWNTLYIRTNSPLFELSKIEKEPEKYGYTLGDLCQNGYFRHWTNRHGLSLMEATKIMLQLKNLSASSKTSNFAIRDRLGVHNVLLMNKSLFNPLTFSNVEEIDQCSDQYIKNYVSKLLHSDQ